MLILSPSDFSLRVPSPTFALDWVRSSRGQSVDEHGTSPPSLLPTDQEIVLVLPPRALSWHRVALPKVAAGRLRAALDGVLEERLLEDTAATHFALEPGARPGQTLWVAACDKAWLRAWLQVLDAAGRPVSRIVPGARPTVESDTPARLHWAFDQGAQAWLCSCHSSGVSVLPLPAAASAVTPDANQNDATWLAEPSVAAQIERALDIRPELVPRSSWLLRCTHSNWNLAQFDLSLSSSARRGQRLRQSLRRFLFEAAWRPARWGLATLLVSLLVGLNALAWSERSNQKEKQLAITRVLQTSFPEVTVVIDAPAQMRRSVSLLRQTGGSLSSEDLEAVLASLAATSPDAVPGRIDFSPGEVQLGGWSVPGDRLQALRQAFDEQGWKTSVEGDTLRLQSKAP